MIYCIVAMLRGWDSHVLSTGQAEEEVGSFRDLFMFASALPEDEVALLPESPEALQVCVVTAVRAYSSLGTTPGSQPRWVRPGTSWE